jgi:hypothetical protein
VNFRRTRNLSGVRLNEQTGTISTPASRAHERVERARTQAARYSLGLR